MSEDDKKEVGRDKKKEASIVIGRRPKRKVDPALKQGSEGHVKNMRAFFEGGPKEEPAPPIRRRKRRMAEKVEAIPAPKASVEEQEGSSAEHGDEKQSTAKIMQQLSGLHQHEEKREELTIPPLDIKVEDSVSEELAIPPSDSNIEETVKVENVAPPITMKSLISDFNKLLRTMQNSGIAPEWIEANQRNIQQELDAIRENNPGNVKNLIAFFEAGTNHIEQQNPQKDRIQSELEKLQQRNQVAELIDLFNRHYAEEPAPEVSSQQIEIQEELAKISADKPGNVRKLIALFEAGESAPSHSIQQDAIAKELSDLREKNAGRVADLIKAFDHAFVEQEAGEHVALGPDAISPARLHMEEEVEAEDALDIKREESSEDVLEELAEEYTVLEASEVEAGDSPAIQLEEVQEQDEEVLSPEDVAEPTVLKKDDAAKEDELDKKVGEHVALDPNVVGPAKRHMEEEAKAEDALDIKREEGDESVREKIAEESPRHTVLEADETEAKDAPAIQLKEVQNQGEEVLSPEDVAEPMVLEEDEALEPDAGPDVHQAEQHDVLEPSIIEEYIEESSEDLERAVGSDVHQAKERRDDVETDPSLPKESHVEEMRQLFEGQDETQKARKNPKPMASLASRVLPPEDDMLLSPSSGSQHFASSQISKLLVQINTSDVNHATLRNVTTIKTNLQADIEAIQGWIQAYETVISNGESSSASSVSDVPTLKKTVDNLQAELKQLQTDLNVCEEILKKEPKVFIRVTDHTGNVQKTVQDNPAESYTYSARHGIQGVHTPTSVEIAAGQLDKLNDEQRAEAIADQLYQHADHKDLTHEQMTVTVKYPQDLLRVANQVKATADLSPDDVVFFFEPRENYELTAEDLEVLDLFGMVQNVDGSYSEGNLVEYNDAIVSSEKTRAASGQQEKYKELRDKYRKTYEDAKTHLVGDKAAERQEVSDSKLDHVLSEEAIEDYSHSRPHLGH